MAEKIKSFDYPQYWKVSYQETRPDGQVFKFRTVLRSKSKKFASEILIKKVEEDYPGSKVSSIRLLRFSSESQLMGKKLSVTDWAHIRNAAFPNELNMLFKK